MQANHRPIRAYSFERGPAVAITTTLAYEEQVARIWAGLRYEDYMALPGARRWVDPDAPTLCKADVVALYRLQGFIEAVSADARMRR